MTTAKMLLLGLAFFAGVVTGWVLDDYLFGIGVPSRPAVAFHEGRAT